MVIASRVKGQFAQQLTVFGDDPDPVAPDQEEDWLAALLVADVKIAQPAQVAHCDSTAGIESVAADAVIDLRLGQRG